MKLNDPELVRRQYETEAGLAVRRPEFEGSFRSRLVTIVFRAEK